MLDPVLMDEIIQLAVDNDLDYTSNTLIEAFPDGQDVEVIKWSALEKSWIETTLKYDREHVTPYVRETPLSLGKIYLLQRTSNHQ